MQRPRRVDTTHDAAHDTSANPAEQGRPNYARPQVEGGTRTRTDRDTPVTVGSQTGRDGGPAETDLEEDPVPITLGEG